MAEETASAKTDAAQADAVKPAEVRQVLSTPAFASHIDGYVVPGHARLNEALLAAIAAWREEDQGMQSSNHLGWHSPRELFQRKEPAFQLLVSHIMAATTKSIRRYWPEFDPARHPISRDGWVNVNGEGAFNGPHGHSSNHLSGTYYVTTPASGPGRSGSIEFLNPAGAVTRLLPFGRKLIQTDIRVHPRAGQMLIFPSYLRHWVYPNQDQEERVSIAFNILVTVESLS